MGKVNVLQCLDGFQLHHKFSIYKNVQLVGAYKLAVITNVHFLLKLGFDATLPKLDFQTVFIDRFQKARPLLTMDGNAGSNHLFGKFFEFQWHGVVDIVVCWMKTETRRVAIRYLFLLSCIPNFHPIQFGLNEEGRKTGK